MWGIYSKDDAKNLINEFDKTIKTDINVYYALDVDLSKYTVVGNVTFHKAPKNINYIPHKIKGDLVFDCNVSFEKLTKNITVVTLSVCDWIDSDIGLTSLKGLQFINIFENIHFEGNQIFQLSIAKQFKDKDVDTLNQKTIDYLNNNLSDNIFRYTKHLKKLIKLLPKSLMEEGYDNSLYAYDRDSQEAIAASYVLLHLYDNIGDTLLEMI